MQMSGISPKVDSCAGLIAKLALSSYARTRPENKRWMDPEDFIQEGLLGAVKAEESHDDGQKQQYSTHAYQAIVWRMQHVNTSLNYPKRLCAGVVEIDAPLPGREEGSRGVQELADPVAGEYLDGYAAFIKLIHTIQSIGPVEAAQAAANYVVAGLLLGISTKAAPEVVELLGVAGKRSGVSYAEIKRCTVDDETRKKVLLWISEAVIMDLGAENKLRCLECVTCEGRFTLAALREKRFSLETMVCQSCYEKMAKSRNSCFGTEFDGSAVECRMHCADRRPCREFIKGRKTMSTETDLATELEALDGGKAKSSKTTKPKSVKVKAKTAVAEKPKKEVKAKAAPEKAEKKSAKTVKPVKAEKKPAKTAKTAVTAVAKVEKKPVKSAKTSKPVKAEKVDDDPAPKELGGVWPWRPGSGLNYCFRRCYDGIKKKTWEALFAKGGAMYGIGNETYMLKHMKAGTSGKAVKTHSWQFSEEGGLYKIYNAAYLLKKKTKAAA